MRQNQRSVLERFNADERGAVLILFAATITVVFGMMAFIIDYSRATHEQSKLQLAADAAATAAAAPADATPDERKEIAKRYFDSNAKGSFDTEPQVSIDVDSETGAVTVAAASQVESTLAGLMGIDSLPVSTLSRAIGKTAAGGKKLEVAMMIDLTGSMGATRSGTTKIDALKLASADIIDVFFPNNAQTSSTTRVAIAPMADYVNAGPYASAVTGLPDRGPFNNRTNLRSTRNGPFSGSHGGSVTGGALGSQSGATSASSAQAGATFDNGHCADPNAPSSPIAEVTHNSKPVGVEVTGSGTAPAQLLPAGAGNYYETNTWDNDDNEWEYNGESLVLSSTAGYYVPIPASTTGVSYLMDSGLYVGVAMSLDGGSSGIPAQMMQASAVGSYQRITGYSNGSFTLTTTNTGYFIPVPLSMTSGGGTLPQCTGTNNANLGYLISCVTERQAADHRTDDEVPSGSSSFLGTYNQTVSGPSNKLNYSEDGKCMTAGRELPEVIPLTNQRAVLEDFFDTATIGGATPGHLGHAWAWYMLSPKWNSLWPGDSRAAEYSDTSVMKAAIIMTDGEYNTQYSSATSKSQALELCAGMRAAGIQVYTIGFGFSNNAADTAATDTLKQCVSNEAGHYFLAYDGQALRQVFKEIGQQLSAMRSNLVLTK